MSGFTKLVPEIIQSSIWNEAAEIRCVWIAMIATKDENGYVRGDARTIARMANVSIESATTALDLFQQADPSSHTPDNEGRRIMPAPGGWIILNHGIYRARDDIYREKARERVRRFRQKMEGADVDVTLQETQQKRNPSASVSVSASESGGGMQGGRTFDAFWQAYPRKVGKKAALKAWKAANDKPDIAVMLKAIENQRRSEQWRKDGGAYIPYPATWLNQGRWADEVVPAVDGKPSDEWRRAFDAIADAVWTAREQESAVPGSIKRAIQAARDKWKDVPKRGGKDVVSAAVDMAMNNRRAT